MGEILFLRILDGQEKFKHVNLGLLTGRIGMQNKETLIRALGLDEFLDTLKLNGSQFRGDLLRIVYWSSIPLSTILADCDSVDKFFL